jgi:hypothetical protein
MFFYGSCCYLSSALDQYAASCARATVDANMSGDREGSEVLIKGKKTNAIS